MKRGIPLLVLILASGTTVLRSETTRTEQEVRVVTGGAVQDPQLTLPKLVNYTRPVYSDEARRRDIEGVVTVTAVQDNSDRIERTLSRLDID